MLESLQVAAALQRMVLSQGGHLGPQDEDLVRLAIQVELLVGFEIQGEQVAILDLHWTIQEQLKLIKHSCIKHFQIKHSPLH